MGPFRLVPGIFLFVFVAGILILHEALQAFFRHCQIIARRPLAVIGRVKKGK
jgi:hypothetical protein